MWIVNNSKFAFFVKIHVCTLHDFLSSCMNERRTKKRTYTFSVKLIDYKINNGAADWRIFREFISLIKFMHHQFQFFSWSYFNTKLDVTQQFDAIFREINSLGMLKQFDQFFIIWIHSVEITEIYPHSILAKISWNQRIY